MAEYVKLFLPFGLLIVSSLVLDPGGWRKASLALPILIAATAIALGAATFYTRSRTR